MSNPDVSPHCRVVDLDDLPDHRKPWGSIPRRLPTVENEVDGIVYGALRKSVDAIWRDRKACNDCTMLTRELDCGRPSVGCRVVDGDADFDLCPELVRLAAKRLPRLED